MHYYDIKFSLDFDNYHCSIIKHVFNNLRSTLNWRFDENFNVNLMDGDIDYQVKDVSDLQSDEIDEIIDSFFRFNFDDIVDVALYRFLVLKNNNELKVLAIINSLIFDYSSINDFYELFDDLNKSYPKKDLDTYYGDLKDYSDSSNFKKDSQYWTEHIFNSNNYVNFYNLKGTAYKSQTINVDRDCVLTFLENQECSLFDFYGSAFSLYLSRINRIEGCLLNSIIPGNKTDLGVFDKTTLLKIDVNDDDSFNDLLNAFHCEFQNSLNHSTVDVENYLDENASYYSIHDFNDLNGNIRVYTGQYSALTLNIYENYLELIYNCDLFSDEYAEHMARNIESLINNVLSSPNQAAGNVDILSSEEKALLFDYCKGKTVEVDKDKLLSESFRQHALANPDAIAVDDGVNQVTYGQLEKSSNSIARDLYENHDIGPGSHVGLMLHRDYHFPELVLALNKIGAAYVPIDLLFPANRIGHMLTIAEATHLITTETIAQGLDLNVNVISIEDLSHDDDCEVEILAKSDNLFAILFTSGTTGIPKGVMFHNKQVPWFSAAFADIFNFSHGDVLGSYFSFSFVASFMICVSLYFGGIVRLFNENEQKNSLLLIKALKETHINNLILPPAVGIPIFENEDLNLDYLILAGAKLNELSKKDRHTKLVNFYGTTEVLFAISKIYDLKDIEDDRVPIGRPVANTWTYILDENGNQMPIGVPGEICISSSGITQGYYNDPESTSKVYVDNPFCEGEINKRMYCTGDIGFYNFDGEIEIIGREDDQLSVRGFRVESKEILTIMRSFEEISDIYLDVDYDNLVAYYTTSDDLDINEVKEALKDNLPYYMIPSLFIELDKIPLNINGKIDKTSLKVVTNNENIEISDEVISCIVDAFKEVLNLDSVLIDDDFVSLGGNSLSAMKLQLLLKEKLGVCLSSNELIDLSTPQDIANHIKFNLNVHSTVDEEKYTFDDSCPLSESQLNIYLDESVNDMGTAYNNSFKIDFKDNYSVSEIKDALMKLFETFPILKARISNNDGVLSFVFDAKPEIIDGSLNDIQSFVKPFEFDRYLSRFLVVDDGSSIILCADFHHLIFDGTSLNVLLNQFSSILDNGGTDFIDKGVLRQVSFEEHIDSGYMDDAHKFFEEMLADRDEVYELLPSLNGSEEEFELIDTFDVDIEKLSSFLQNHSMTYNQFFTSVFAYTLSRFSGSDKVLFNIIEDGRGHIDLSQSVGMFVKTLPVLMDCKNQDVASYLEYSSKLINSVMKYDMYPFRVLASDYDLNSNLVFQYSHDLFSDVINKEDLKYGVDELAHDLDADLAFNILNNGQNRLTIRILYSTLYSKGFIEHFADSYKLILNDIIEVDQLKDINYISEGDIELLDEYNQTGHPLSYNDVLDAFNDNLMKCPESKLVEYGDVSYTYAEGAYIADAIGKKLIDLGIKTQDKVSFLVPRSELYMFSTLGIVSIGGIYVPLDDALPDERIEFMMEDTESKVLIVSDETYERGCNLANDCTILNISEIVKGDIKSLDYLDVSYGDLACILYTSGTTGIPKGVKVTRKSVVNYADYYVSKSGIRSGDVFSLYASIGFDVGAVKSIFVPVYVGACLDVIPYDIRFDIAKLNQHLIDYNVTHAHLPSQVAKLFISDVEDTSLNVLVTGGDKLGEVDFSGDYIFVDSYGPTEACVSVTSTEVPDKIHYSSVGKLFNNTRAFIVDKEFRRVPIGAVGELCLAGYQVADGYLNRDEETAKAFWDNPFDDDENYCIFYRTGDMVRLLPDGSIAIVGRRDGQVKIRGNRVELSEIESVIRELDHVEDVTVQTIKNNDNRELVAYVVMSQDMGEEALKNLICDYVGEHKPDYMIPSFVMKLDAIPVNVNGKVDKSAFPDVDLSSLHAEYVAPTNEVERHIVDAFEVVFNQKGIGINDDFVRLGGDSITAIRVISLLERNGISCSARDILNYKTPYLIAQNVEKITKVSYDVTEEEVELLPIQSYFFDQVNRNDFSQEFVLKSKSDLDLDILQRAFDELTNVHDMLRATFRYDGDKVVQDTLPLNTRICEIKQYNTDNLKDTLDNIIGESKDALDIADELVRISLIRHDGECYVAFVIHHLIVDGVSWSILLDDLTHIYTQLENNDEIDILRPYPYKSWVEDVKSLADEISDDERQHWIEVNGLLDDSTIKGESKGFAFNVDASFDADNLLMLSEEEYLALSIARAYKKTFDEDIIFNREVHGRDENLADVSHTFGWFTSQFPVVVNVDNGYDAVSLMRDVYNIKDSFKDVEHLGLNYGSMIYNSRELEYRHCPVTFNFLSSEFSFENDLFESINTDISFAGEIGLFDFNGESYGITLNVVRQGNSYSVIGDYASDTYLGDAFDEFRQNIKSELEFIGGFDFKDNNVVCCLSESQLGVYLDEKINKKDAAYSNPGSFECGSDYSVGEIEDAIHALVSKHPILRSRVLDTDGVPLLICDAYPSIETVSNDDYSALIKPFDLDKSLSRFYIVDNGGDKSVFYVIHHIISDATTITLINKELKLALMGHLDDEIDLGFAYASRDSFESKYDHKYKSARKFFHDEFADIDEVRYLLGDVDGNEGSVSLPIRGIREKAESFVHERGITTSNLLNAVFAYTYSRFTGSNKVCYNFTEHGRHEDYLQDSLGMFIRTIPVLVDCENRSVGDFVDYMSDLTLNSMANSSYPFRLLAREFNLNNNVLFEYNHNLNDFSIGSDMVVRDEADGVSEFLCVVNDLEDGFVVTVSHLDKFSQHTAEQFVKAFGQMLIQFLQKDDLKDINYISDEDIGILDAINQTERPLEYDDILDAFNANLSRYPDNKLVSFNQKSYSYAECAFIADKMAKSLKEHGVVPGDNVSFLVERSELYMFSILSILSVGAVYVPLDDAHPDNRIEFMLEDTASKVVIVDDSTLERVKSFSSNADILNISDILKGDLDSLSNLPIVYGQLACILYTSGTTGVPKGVKITRKSLLNVSESYIENYGLSNNDVYGLFSSIGFDVSSFVISVVMRAGACLSVIPEDIRLNMSDLNNYFIKQNVSHAFITTQVGKLFMQSLDDTSLDVLLVAGEKLGEFESPRNYRLVDAYGPTEAFAFVSSIDNDSKVDASSIGMLNHNTHVYILDDEKRRVPCGAVGELYLSGLQIADGYLNRPEENDVAFIDNPFRDDENHDVLYRTGDMVRVLPDGSLAIVGRGDGQVKVRGNRVELSEIESVIRELDYVEDVTVQTIKNNDNNELVAYVVISQDMSEDDFKKSICDYVGEHKPDYMVPSFVMKLDAIPLNVNDKVDKSALPDVDLSSLQTEYVLPTNEIERHIVDAFEVVFNQKGIGLNDDFVRLGGDSIAAIRVISLLERNDISCSARDILNYKTPYLIAQNVEHVAKISYDETEGEVELLPIQSYFFDQINDDDFSQEFVLKSKADLDLDILQRAFDELANVHDMLRATFRYEDDKVVQEILPLNSSVCKIKEYNADNLNDALGNVTEELKRALDIGDGLIKIGLIRCAGECYVAFVIHHLIIDGVSWSILLDDLTHIYTQLENNDETNLLRPYPYKSWVEDVRSLAADISDDERQHWIEVNGLLDDSAIRGKSKGFTFNVDASFDIDNLLMLSEEEYFALSIARAYKKTFGKDIIFNRESYGRDESLADVSRTIGWFTSQFPVVVNVDNGYDAVSLMRDVYSIKDSFKDVEHLGLNYGSMIYTSHELEYKHCPVTFNFLSSEFSFKNEMFESINRHVPFGDEMGLVDLDFESFGISFNVDNHGGSYNIFGHYADSTYIGDSFELFVENIKYELNFIGNFNFSDENIVCCLSESQLGVYLDEKANEKGTAYSTPGTFEYDSKYSDDEIKDAIHALINKHPILRGRILDTEDIPLLICDSDPPIEIVSNVNYHDLVKPFDLDKSLARFFIVDNGDYKFVFYDMHHIISDATTRPLINRELDKILAGNLEDKIDLGFAYASRDSFESKYGPKYKSAQKFFRDMFGDIDDVQYLLEDIDGSTGSVSLPIRGIRSKVESFTQKNAITTSNLLNAVFAYTYSRFTASNKVCYNFTEHGRHEDYLKDALGMFVRTVPILIDCENRTVSDFVTGTSDLILKSMANSSYPFRLLAREFNLTNDVVFEYNYDLVDFDIGNDIVVRKDADGVSEFSCVVNDLDDGFVVTVSHLDRFSQHTAKQFVKVFKEILIQILEKENLADISYISAEDAELLNSYNQTEHQFVHKDILDAFNDNLPEHENNVLVGYNNRSYTHGQGAFIAGEIGSKLNNLGIVKQDYVALFVNRSEWFLLASMGVLSVGGIYVPIDTSYPDERVIFMIEDTKSKVVIVDNDSEERMKSIIAENDLDIDVLNVSNITSQEISSSNHLDTVEVDEEDIACVLYTSGTTGVPKGVLITRKAINNFVSWYVDETNFTSSDVYGMHCSYVFDIHTAALYSPVITGGSLYVVPEDIRLDLKALNDYYVEHGCTHTYITSQVGKLFAESGMETTIKLLCFGGMKLGELNAPDSIGPFESYGPSENLAISTSIFANKRIHHSSIGRFISNVKGYVLDNELRRVPLGAQGELYLSGAQLTPGYLNRGKENEESFFDNPFDDEKGYECIYKTGDIVRFLPDGTLGIVGRRDSQVKIRGNRVELTEVESSIRSMDIVEDVTVQTITNNANKELVAYVVINSNLDDDELYDSVCSHVNACKPEYMVPSYVVKLDSIPLNVNGKVDKRALPDVDRASLHVEYAAPRNENEKEVVEAFKKALNLEEVGIYDDFIRLGGDSLIAIRLLSYINSNDVTMADILTFRTPEAIAKNMSDFSFDLDLYTLESGCPLNAAQLNVFADVTIYNKKNAYHVPGYIPISKEHGLEDIFNALDELLNIHPVLGMCLSDRYEVNDADDMGNLDMVDDLLKTAKKFGIRQLINVGALYGLRDLGGLYNMIKTTIRLFKGEYPYMVKGEKPPISVKSEVGTDTIIGFFTESLDIYKNLSKFMIVETDQSYYLFYVIHHIIFDAVSAGVFKHDFEILLDGGSVSLDDTFLKASAFTQQIKNTDKFEEAREYYYPILSSIDDVGTLLEDNSSEGYSRSTWDLKFDKRAFKSFLNNAGISENVLFTSVFAYALSQFVDGDKVLFTMIENGRDRFNGNFIGMTSNVMPLVADCKDRSIDSFIKDMADAVYGISRHSYYPILLLYQKYNFEVNTLFQFVPNWIADDFSNDEGIDDIDSEEIVNRILNSYGDNITEFFVEIYQNGENYRLIITNSNKYSNKMVEDFKDTYMSVLSNIINSDLHFNLNTALNDVCSQKDN